MGVKRPSDAAAAEAAAPASAEPSRLFVVCGRGRKLDDLRALFSACGRIRHLHLALDRSNKSRGFAFLQYDSQVDAARAIERFDQMTLDDGHVLKVTVAKEKPSGKLKRDQHARREADAKRSGRPGVEEEEEEAALDGHAPGKRQRSSPPQASLPPSRSITAPSLPLESMGPDTDVDTTEVRKAKRERVAKTKQTSDAPRQEATLSDAKPPPLSDSYRVLVAQTMEDMLTALDRHTAGAGQDPRDLFPSYLKAQASRPGLAGPDGGLSASDEQARATQLQRKPVVSIKVEEATTDMITSSIGSVSITGKPTARSPQLPAKSAASAYQTFATTGSGALRSGKSMLRRRRQSTDDSDSSGEDGQDGGGNRRKRSNTTVTPPHQGPPSYFALPRAPENSVMMESPARYADVCPSNNLIDPAALARKQCKRQSSGDVHDKAFRSAKQQITGSGHHPTELNPQAAGSDSVDARTTSLSPLARSRLFFVSTHKFTLQELEAMFSAYRDFEWVQIVKSFGRVKTMAYIKYSEASAAAEVIQSFEGEVSTDDNDPDFIKLTFADPVRSTPISPGFMELKPRRDSMELFSTRGEFAELDAARRPHERLWLLLLFDRLVPNHMLSSTVTTCPGMEFVDIKLSKATGESQGVAFVKFETEQHAFDAARELHQTELPIGSGKALQALVIADPGQFSTAYGSGAVEPNGDGSHRGGAADDVDIGAVEARFAHLMRSTGTDHHYSSQPPPAQLQFSRDYDTEPPMVDSSHNGHPPMLSMFPGSYPSAAPAAYASTGMYGAAPSSSSMGFYPAPIPMPPPQYHHQPLPPHPVAYDNQPYGYSGWMEPPQPYFHPQYALVSPAPQRPEMLAFPMRMDPMRMDQPGTFEPARGVAGRAEAKPDRRPLSPSSSDISMGSGESTSGNEVRGKLLASSILVSSDRPMDFVAIVSALRDCSGMVAFRTDAASGSADGCAYAAQFADEAQALAAVARLDGTMCQGVKLRVGLLRVGSGAKSGKSTGGASSRRKRQRVDARSKGRSDV